MQFNTPVNESDMIYILRQIYGYYRVRHEEIQENELEELSLQRLEFIPLTDAELTEKATLLTAAARQREKEGLKAEIEEKIAVLSEQIKSAEENAVLIKKDITAVYEKAKAETLEDLKKNGLSKSSVAIERLAELKKSETEDLKAAERKKLDDVAFSLAKIKGLTVKKENVDKIVDAIYEKAVTEKFLELKDEQDKLEREVFKYNNGLDEKEQRYRNDILYKGTLFQVRKAEILQKEYAKEELVNMGYYADVIACVRAYFDTLPPVSAYHSFKDNVDIVPFLDDFYSQVLYYYERNALVSQT